MNKQMTLNEYQKRAMSTCMPSCDNISYMLLNLVGEVGEFSSKIAKAIRKEDIYIGGQKDMKGLSKLCIYPHFIPEFVEFNEELMKEAGDMLWQLFGVFSALGWSAEDIALGNLEKLADRAIRGKIEGNGDNR